MNKKRVELVALALIAVVGSILMFALHEYSKSSYTENIAQAITAQRPIKASLTRSNLLNLVNKERYKYGVTPLIEDDMLDQSAQWKADDMVMYSYFGHFRDSASTADGLDYLKSLPGVNRSSTVSENIATGNTAIDAMN